MQKNKILIYIYTPKPTIAIIIILLIVTLVNRLFNIRLLSSLFVLRCFVLLVVFLGNCLAYF